MSGAKPFLWFGCADGTLTKAEVTTPRTRLARELQSIISYMAQCDLEKSNEPVVVLFSRLSPDVIRSGVALPGGSTSTKDCPTAPPPTGDVSATEFWRVQALSRAIEEAREKMNPRFIMVVSVQQPWLWTFVFLRSHDNLRAALHRLAPNAVQLLADRPQAVTPGLLILDDLTPGQDVLQRLRPRISHELRPLLLWMGHEDMESPHEHVVVLYVCTDVRALAQRFVVAPTDQRRGSATAIGVGGIAALNLQQSLAELGDADLQRMLLARDRLYDVVHVLQPRLVVLVNWLVDPDNWLLVLCRDQGRLAAVISKILPPTKEVCVWAPRHLPQPAGGKVADFCYSNACPLRGQIQAVQFCPGCQTAKYCSATCQAEHWNAGHCRFCPRLQAAKLRRATVAAKSGMTTARSSTSTSKKR